MRPNYIRIQPALETPSRYNPQYPDYYTNNYDGQNDNVNGVKNIWKYINVFINVRAYQTLLWRSRVLWIVLRTDSHAQ